MSMTLRELLVAHDTAVAAGMTPFIFKYEPLTCSCDGTRAGTDPRCGTNIWTCDLCGKEMNESGCEPCGTGENAGS